MFSSKGLKFTSVRQSRRKYFALLTVVCSIVGMAAPVHAAILFQDDTFATIESDAIMIGSNDSGARSTAIQFGADGSAAQNGNIQFDISARQFNVDHPVQITNLGSGDSFQVNDEPSDTTPFIIQSDGDTLIGTNTQTAGDPEKLKVEAGAGQTNVITSSGDINANLYNTLLNRNSGTLAKTEFRADADNSVGTADTTATGMTSSGFSSPTFTLAGPDDGFLISHGNDLIIDTGNTGAPIKFATGGALTANERMRIDGTGNVGINTTTPGSKLDVKGDLRLSGTTSGYVGFIAPAVSGTTTYTLPSTDGLSDQRLSTNGAGVLSWSDPGGYWQRVGTVLSPLTAGDSVTTSGGGTITSDGLLTGNTGLTITGGVANLNASSNNNTNINTGTSTGTLSLGNSLAGAISAQSASTVTLQSGSSTLTTGNSNITLQPGGTGTTGNVQVGAGGAGSTTPDLLGLDVKSTTGDPAGANGEMYYNAFSNKFRCYINGSWGDCDTTGGTATLQSSYNAGNSITTGSSTPIQFNLTSGDFNATGAGAVNLTPTAASQFTSGGALTLTGGATSDWGTTSGDLTLHANSSASGDVNIGADDTPSATPDILSLDQKNVASGTGDPVAGGNGDMYYNDARDRFRCFEAGGWKDCGQTAASSTTLQAAYNAGNAISTSGSNLAFTLNGTDQLTASGAGSVNLTPTGASSFTSGGALTLTGGAASTFSTTAGALTINSGTTTPAALNLGTAGSNAVNIGSTGVTTTNNGSLTSTQTLTASNGLTLTTGALNLTSTSGALSLAGLGASSISTGSNSLALVGSPININATGTGTTNIGSATGAVNLPGLTASKVVFTDASKNLTSTGTVAIAQGGTGQTTQTTAFNALSPLTTKGDLIVYDGTNNIRLPVGGTNGQMLSVDSTQTAGIKWITPNAGTVTSVSGSGGTTGLTLTGGPITSSGTLTLGGTLGVANGGTGDTTLTNHGVLVGAGTSAVTQLAAAAAGTLLSGQGASTDPSFTATPTLGVAGTTLGTLSLSGNTSGTIAIKPQAAAGTYNFNLPTTAGTSGQPLLSGGGVGSPMTFGTLGVAAGGTGLTTFGGTNTILFTTAADTLSNITTANNGILITSGAGVPSISSTLPSAVQGNITGTGTLTSGATGAGFTLNFGTSTLSGAVPIANGGTGQTTAITGFNALSPLTTKGDILTRDATNNIRLGVGTNGQVLSADSTQTSGLKWISPTSGTVTSVDVSGDSTGLTFTGGPITSSGTITMGGTLGLTNGGTNNSLTASNGGVVYSDASKLNILAGNATAGKVLQSGASAAPTWSTPTYPSGSGSAGKILRSDGTNNVYSTSTFADTYTASNLLYSNDANTITGLATANNGVLLTNGSGVPSITSTIDFSNATSFTLPKGTTDPATCTVGQQFYNTTSNTDRVCTATNTWTNVSAGGTGHAILSGGTDANAAATFIGPAGNSNTEAQVNTPIPYACTAKNLQASVEVAFPSGKNLTFTIRKNSADTAVTCTINTVGPTTCSDTTNSVAFAAGDLWDVATTTTAAPPGKFIKVAFECD